MSKKDIKVPNIGEFKDVEVIEVLIKKGQKIKKNDPLITIESDKSSVEIPSSDDGISKLDLSLSIVISGSFFFIFWPFLIKTSITSTSLNSPKFGTFISFFDIIILSALVYLYLFDTSLLLLQHI